MTANNQPIQPASSQQSPIVSQKRKKLRLGISIATPLIIIIGLYFIVYPFWPRIQYALWPPKDTSAGTNVNTSNTNGQSAQILNKVPLGNKIIIPKIGVNMQIVEGTNEKTALNQGAWRMPQTSTPDTGGNTVITAHRFKYRPPSQETFYLLDKMVIGDTFVVNWNGLEYNYKITETRIVEPSAIEVLDNTESPRVTLITCTPLFTTKQRLIVIGEPI